jgi:hypothetical protein
VSDERISVLATEYSRAEVIVRDSGIVPNLSTDVVRMAFPVKDVAPIAGDWKTASWEVDATTSPSRYYARCLVGPAGTALAVGIYDKWVEVTHSPELPKIKADGRLEVF